MYIGSNEIKRRAIKARKENMAKNLRKIKRGQLYIFAEKHGIEKKGKDSLIISELLKKFNIKENGIKSD